MRVLIVDDSMLIRNIFRSSLEGEIASTNLITAKNGEEALSIVEQEGQEIAIVLVDWNMPKLNGLEFVKQVRSNNMLENIVLIMITSEAAQYNVMDALEAGVDEYLIKPVSPVQIRQIVKKYIS